MDCIVCALVLLVGVDPSCHQLQTHNSQQLTAPIAATAATDIEGKVVLWFCWWVLMLKPSATDTTTVSGSNVQ
jgi:hypothetical protein